MEQIEQALRKAREQRQNDPAARAANSLPNFSAPVSVRYTETQVIPFQRSQLERNRVIATQLGHPVTDTYRSLRAQVLQALGHLGKATLGITSANQGEGKTLTAVNLAIAIAMDVNQTVLLVDADLRHPSVSKYLGISPQLGLGDYLAGRAQVSECLYNPGIERLSILPSRDSAGNSAELLASPQMAQLAKELKARYPDRLIIYDLPPLLDTGDTLGFLPSVDATLLVVREGAVRRSELQRAVDLLAGFNLLGTVLNAAE